MSTMSELDRVRKEQARLEAEAAYCEQALIDAKAELNQGLTALKDAKTALEEGLVTLTLTDPDNAKDAQIDSLREDQQIVMDEKYSLESDKILDSEDDIPF